MTRDKMITAAVFTVTATLFIPAASRGAEGADGEAIRAMFARIDLAYPGLEKVKAALDRDDLPAAEAAYLEFWRTRDDQAILWNPNARLFTLQFRNGEAADFFIDPPKTISWRDREKLKDQIFLDGTWQYTGKPSKWTLLELADLMLENKIVHIRRSTYMKPKRMGEKWCWFPADDMLYRHYFMPVLAQAYWVTGDDRYVSKLIELWVDWIRTPTKVKTMPFYVMQNIWFQVSTLEMVIQSPALKPRDFCLIVANLSGPMAKNLTSVECILNQLSGQVNALLTLVGAFPESKERDGWLKMAYKYIDRLGELSFPDGGFSETTFFYSVATAVTFLVCRDNLKALEEHSFSLPPVPEALGRTEQWGEYFMYNVRPDWRLPWTGHGRRGFATELLELLVEIHPEREDFLFCATKGEKGKPPEHPSAWFPWAGYCSMRDQYGPETNHLFFDIGPCGTGHKNANKLMVIVAAHGRTLLDDRGCPYYGDQHKDFTPLRDYCYGHSTVIVDGKSQPLRDEVPTAPQDNPWTSTEVLDFNAGKYVGPYVPTRYTSPKAGKEDTGVVHHRSVVFVKPDYWIVTDRLLPAVADQPKRERTFEQLFHFIPCEVKQDTQTLSVSSTTAGEPNLTLIPVRGDGDLTLEIIEGRRKPYPLGWHTKGHEPNNREFNMVPSPCVVYRRKSNMPTVMQMVLWPQKAGETEQPKVEPLDGLPPGAAKVTLSDGRVDLYYSTSEPCEFELAGSRFHSLAALVRLNTQGHIVAKQAIKP